MGAAASLLFGDQEEIHDVVLVPPLFERDHKGRSRLAKSSYDFLFIKPNLRWLFNDYLPVGAVKSILYFSPPEDPRISVTARFKASVNSDGKKYMELGDSKYGKDNSRYMVCHQSCFNTFTRCSGPCAEYGSLCCVRLLAPQAGIALQGPPI